MNKKIKKVIKKIVGMFLILIIVLIVLGVSLINPVLGKKMIKKAKKFYHRIRDNIGRIY